MSQQSEFQSAGLQLAIQDLWRLISDASTKSVQRTIEQLDTAQQLLLAALNNRALLVQESRPRQVSQQDSIVQTNECSGVYMEQLHYNIMCERLRVLSASRTVLESRAQSYARIMSKRRSINDQAIAITTDKNKRVRNALIARLFALSSAVASIWTRIADKTFKVPDISGIQNGFCVMRDRTQQLRQLQGRRDKLRSCNMAVSLACLTAQRDRCRNQCREQFNRLQHLRAMQAQFFNEKQRLFMDRIIGYVQHRRAIAMCLGSQLSNYKKQIALTCQKREIILNRYITTTILRSFQATRLRITDIKINIKRFNKLLQKMQLAHHFPVRLQEVVAKHQQNQRLQKQIIDFQRRLQQYHAMKSWQGSLMQVNTSNIDYRGSSHSGITEDVLSSSGATEEL